MEDKRSVGFTFTKAEGKQEVCKAKHTMKKMLHVGKGTWENTDKQNPDQREQHHTMTCVMSN